MKKERSIDDIFKHSLQNPANEPDFAAHDWDALENMLDKKAKGGKVLWMPYAAAVAAMILIAFGWWLFTPTATNVQNGQAIVKNKVQPKQQSPVIDTVTTGNGDNTSAAIKPNQAGDDETIVNQSNAGTSNETTTAEKNKQPAYIASNKAKRDALNDGAGIEQNNGAVIGQRDALSKSDDIIADARPAFNVLPADLINAAVLASIETPLLIAPVRPWATNSATVKKNNPSAVRPQFALAILASPEINGIGSFQGNSRGSNVGMMFSVGLSKFTFSTGATYSLKPYSLPFSQYPSTGTYYKTKPEMVTADCRILDIPINVGYQVYNKSRNKISLGTGVSSYIMMHESYTYDYGNAARVYGPSYYAVKGRGKYPFSVMNVQATYERQINSKFGLSLQPYYKIPLSAIGYSQVRVQTFGVAVGLSWNINQLTKPK